MRIQAGLAARCMHVAARLTFVKPEARIIAQGLRLTGNKILGPTVITDSSAVTPDPVLTLSACC